VGLLRNEDHNRIAKFELFSGLTADQLASTLTGGISRQLKHREYLYHAGDKTSSFCVVVNGALKLIRHSPKGEDIIVHFAVEGDMVGALLMNQDQDVRYPISAKSMGPTEVVCIPRTTFQQHWVNNVQIQSKLNSILYRRMINIQDDKTLFTSPLRVRIANLLMRHLAQDADKSETTLSLALTRQEIADSLGVAVESVIRAMSEWQDDGTLTRLGDRGPEIINVPKLLKNRDF